MDSFLQFIDQQIGKNTDASSSLDNLVVTWNDFTYVETLEMVNFGHGGWFCLARDITSSLGLRDQKPPNLDFSQKLGAQSGSLTERTALKMFPSRWKRSHITPFCWDFWWWCFLFPGWDMLVPWRVVTIERSRKLIGMDSCHVYCHFISRWLRDNVGINEAPWIIWHTDVQPAGVPTSFLTGQVERLSGIANVIWPQHFISSLSG